MAISAELDCFVVLKSIFLYGILIVKLINLVFMGCIISNCNNLNLLIDCRFNVSSNGEYNENISDSQIKEIAHTVLDYLKNNKNEFYKKWRNKTLSYKEIKTEVDPFISKMIISPWKKSAFSETISKTQDLAMKLIRGEEVDLKKIEEKYPLFRAIILKHDVEMLRETKSVVNQFLNQIFQEINKESLTEKQSFHMEIIVGELLSLFPFFRPQEGEVLQVPVRIDGKWVLIDYEVNRLELTPEHLGSPLVAYGLKPQNKKAPPLILFKGTTYPTDEGFTLSLLVDINPGAAVGSFGFQKGKGKIESWLDENTTDQKAVVYGKSLGGALSWQAGINFHEKIAKVMTYGSPGFLKKDLRKLEEIPDNSKPEFHFFCQKNDLIPFVGEYARKGVNYYQIIGRHTRKGGIAHADMFSAHEKSIVIPLPPSEMESKYRYVLNLLRNLISFVFPFFLFAQIVAVRVINFKGWMSKHEIYPL